jgi:hypothetical protein
MNAIKIIVVMIFAFTGTGFTTKGIWIIDAESQLTIQGSTNVNDFTCKIAYCTGTDTLQYIENSTTRELRFTRSRMTVPIRSFDCGAKSISKDFWKTLQAETYPNLEINFISLQNLYFKDKTTVKGIVDITLAGVTSRYAICYKVTLRPNGNVLLEGTHAVNFSDFQLVAPEKLKGLIKVKEVLNVDFNLVLKEV